MPKHIEHVIDLPPQKPSKRQRKHKEDKRDIIPQADLAYPGAFLPKQDPYAIDFEKIALLRAAKQADFQRKYKDEQKPWDLVHGGRFTYQGEHRAEDKEMADHPDHAALDKAFDKSIEEYH